MKSNTRKQHKRIHNNQPAAKFKNDLQMNLLNVMFQKQNETKENQPTLTRLNSANTIKFAITNSTTTL